jgi:hypothetical protein
MSAPFHAKDYIYPKISREPQSYEETSVHLGWRGTMEQKCDSINMNNTFKNYKTCHQETMLCQTNGCSKLS